MSGTLRPASSEWVFDEQAFLRKIPYPVVPTNLKGVYAGVAPPDDFDPNTASPSELIKNGILWRRPTAADPPAFREAWQKVFSRKWLAKDRIVPTLEPQVGRTHILKKAPRKISDTNYLGYAWSGAVSFTGGPYVGICGIWTVPTVSNAPQPPSSYPSYDSTHYIAYDSSSWVGMDGFGASTDVLQTGVEQYVDTSGNPHYVAWYEWSVPNPPDIAPSYVYQTPIPDFPVSAGDEMFGWVSYLGTTAGVIYLANNTTGQHFSITLPPPPDATFSGNSVEWIMEDPDGGEGTNTALAKFTPVEFTFCLACSPSATNTLGDSTCNIETLDGQVLTSVTLGDYAVTIDFIG